MSAFNMKIHIRPHAELRRGRGSKEKRGREYVGSLDVSYLATLLVVVVYYLSQSSCHHVGGILVRVEVMRL